MHVAIVLLLCSTVMHVGISQMLPAIPPRTETAVPAISKCDLGDLLAFITSNGIDCIVSYTTLIFNNPPSKVASALEIVCTDDCGGISSKFSESLCSRPTIAELFRIYCTPTNGSATAGDLCYYALPNILDSQFFDEISVCDNVTSDSSCSPGCREFLIKIKTQIGCCLQNIYNNTMYDMQEFVNNGFLTQSEVDRLQKLTTGDSNPWMICDVEPPESCGAPLFKPPAPPTCTRDDHLAFLSSLPNAAVCSASIANASILSANDSTELAKALDNVCTDDCEGAYSNFLKNTCNDQFLAEVLRIWCIRTNGSATTGPYCSFAADAVRISYLSSCSGILDTQICSPSCRSALLQFSDLVGCCYQDVFNNTFLYQQLVLNGIITPSEFTLFTIFPFGNPWTVCNVPVPNKCPEQPPADGKHTV